MQQLYLQGSIADSFNGAVAWDVQLLPYLLLNSLPYKYILLEWYNITYNNNMHLLCIDQVKLFPSFSPVTSYIVHIFINS